MYYGGTQRTTGDHGAWSTTGDHGRPRFTMGGHGVLRGTTGKLKLKRKFPVQYHGGTRRTTGDHGAWSTTGDHGRPRKTTIYYGGARHTTGDHGEILLIFFALSFDFYKKR